MERGRAVRGGVQQVQTVVAMCGESAQAAGIPEFPGGRGREAVQWSRDWSEPVTRCMREEMAVLWVDYRCQAMNEGSLSSLPSPAEHQGGRA